MLITKTSMFSGKSHTIDLPVTQEQLDCWRKDRVLIQHAMPNLEPWQREFLMTGVTKEEWEEEFGEE